jgi:acetolactate synthase-1/2/3 large subunit
MTGFELLTAVSQSAPVMVLVLRDRELAQIAQFQSVAMYRKSNSVLPEFDLQALAKAVGAEFLSMRTDADVESVLERAISEIDSGNVVLVEVNIDYSQKTHFTRGVVNTNLGRLPLKDRARFIGRALGRRITERFR